MGEARPGSWAAVRSTQCTGLITRGARRPPPQAASPPGAPPPAGSLRSHIASWVVTYETLHQLADPVDPNERLGSREALRDALRAIDELPPAQRKALRLAVLEGWSYEEIAEHLGVSENTVKTRVSRARARLRTSAPSAFAGIRA